MKRAKLHRLGVAVACLSLACVAGAAAPPQQASSAGSSMLGFTADGAAQQRSLEKRFDSLLSASEMRG